MVVCQSAGGGAVGCSAVLAHGSDEDAVAQGGAADGELLEELRYGLCGSRGCGCAGGGDVLGREVFEVGHADVDSWWWCHVGCKVCSFSFKLVRVWRCRCWVDVELTPIVRSGAKTRASR